MCDFMLSSIYPCLDNVKAAGGTHLYLESKGREIMSFKARLGYIKVLQAALGYITKSCLKKKKEVQFTLLNSAAQF